MARIKELLKKKYIRFICLAFSGILTGLTVCFPAVGLLEWISMIPAFLALISILDDEKRRLRSLYLYGLFYFMCYFVTCWHWFFVMYPMSYTGMNELAAFTVLLAAVLGLPLLQSVAYAFVFVLFGFISRGRLLKRYVILAPFVMASLFTVFEWMQTLFWFGVPWGRLAIGQAETLVTLQSASLFGTYFVSFLLVCVNALVAYAIYKLEAARLTSVTALSVFVVNTLFGAAVMVSDPIRQSDDTVKVAVIQGNISTSEKWDELNWYENTSGIYTELTAAAANEGAEIVIWPETVLPVYFETSNRSQNLVRNLAKEYNVVLMFGTVTYGDDNGQYNTILTVFPDGTISDQTYYKQHLVPFGEHVPWRAFITTLIPALEHVNVLPEDFTAGHSSTVVDTGRGVVGSAICFDSIYENTVRKSVLGGAEIIAIETNDSWFYDSAAVRIHKNQAVIRAIENGRYVVRSANTGVSAIISDTGEVICEKEPLVAGYCVSDVELHDGYTLYTRIGNTFVLLTGIFVATFFGIRVFDKLRERKGAAAND